MLFDYSKYTHYIYYSIYTVFIGLTSCIVMQNVHSNLINMLGCFSRDESVFVCLCVLGVSDIWEEEKKTRAKLITVWATFSDTCYSLDTHGGWRHTQMQLFQVLESRSFFYIVSVSTDKSWDSLCCFTRKMDWVAEGIYEAVWFSCIVIYVLIVHIKMPALPQ